jgi:hypothetical protein
MLGPSQQRFTFGDESAAGRTNPCRRDGLDLSRQSWLLIAFDCLSGMKTARHPSMAALFDKS